MNRYIAGGGLILSLVTFVGHEGWNKIDHAETHAGTAIQLARDVDARQETLEKLVDRQEDYNRRLLRLLERGAAEPAPTPTAARP